MIINYLLISTFLIISTSSTPFIDSRNNQQLRQINEHSSICCDLPKCKEIPLNTEGHSVFQCFKTKVCGDVCTKQQLLPTSFQYRKKRYYINKICEYDHCQEYVFDCRGCPSPHNDFDQYNMNIDCINCFY